MGFRVDCFFYLLVCDSLRCVSMFSGTHEKPVLEAGILEKLVDTVIEMAEKDKENVSVQTFIKLYCIYDKL